MLCYLDDVTNRVSQLRSRVQISLKDEERDEVGREKILPHLIIMIKKITSIFRLGSDLFRFCLPWSVRLPSKVGEGFGKGNNRGNLPSYVGNESRGPPAPEDIFLLASSLSSARMGPPFPLPSAINADCRGKGCPPQREPEWGETSLTDPNCRFPGQRTESN